MKKTVNLFFICTRHYIGGVSFAQKMYKNLMMSEYYRAFRVVKYILCVCRNSTKDYQNKGKFEILLCCCCSQD